MTIEYKNDVHPQRLVIDLDGPQGNAFFLLATAHNLYRKVAIEGSLWWMTHEGVSLEQIQTEMKSGDYENLLQTFDKYFGRFVTLQRSRPESLEDEDEGY